MQKVLGLILELNPFHNGHQYFIDEAIDKVKPDIVIAVISGNYTMRGDLSVIDKFEKTKLALKAKIDVVLELPFISAINSADYFAFNAISILSNFKITDIAFGVELDNIDKLQKLKHLIDSEQFNKIVKDKLDLGHSYSIASAKAIDILLNDSELSENFSLPNNTLAIQYLRSIEKLNQKVNITLIKRIANNYYDEEAKEKIASATSLRLLLENNKDISYYTPDFTHNTKYVNPKIIEDNLFFLLKYIFFKHPTTYFSNIYGVSEGIENRFEKFLLSSNNYSEFVKNVQTKRYSLNKIKRLILHLILNTTNDYYNKANYYLRLLGSNEKGLEYINKLPKDTKTKIITSFKNKLDNSFVNMELNATKIYGLLTNNPDIYFNEFKIPIIGGSK